METCSHADDRVFGMWSMQDISVQCPGVVARCCLWLIFLK
jgi:hypothetical protein